MYVLKSLVSVVQYLNSYDYVYFSTHFGISYLRTSMNNSKELPTFTFYVL